MADMPGVNGGEFLNTVAAAEDGDDVDGASVQLTAQGAANQDKYLADGLCVKKTPAIFWEGLYTSNFKPTIDANTDAAIKLNPHLPHGIKIRTIVVLVDPGAHGGMAPAVRPVLQLFKAGLDGVLVTTWTITDNTSPLATYEVAHDLTLDLGADETIDRETYLYVLQFVQENGANAVNGAIGTARIQLL